MNPTTILLSLAGLAVAIAGIFGFGFLKGVQNESDRHAEFRREVGVASARIQLENERRVELAERHTAEVATRYSRALADLDRDYTSRLGRLRREHAGTACTMSANAGTSGGVDGATEEPGPGTPEEAPQFTEFEAACFAVERNAAADALQLIWLQDWVFRTQGAR